MNIKIQFKRLGRVTMYPLLHYGLTLFQIILKKFHLILYKNILLK